MLSMPEPRTRDVDNLRNWTAGTGCISRPETNYLERGNDLSNIVGLTDSAISYSESVVEECVFRVDQVLEMVGHSKARPEPRKPERVVDD